MAYWYGLFPVHSWILQGRADQDRRRCNKCLKEVGDLCRAFLPVSTMSEPPRRIERSQLVPLPLEDSFAFFADAYNLEALTPPWLRFRILTARPIPMRKGTTIGYVLTLRRLPVRWRTEIIEWEPGRRFIDRQVKGPFRLWEHTHAFE